MRTRKYDVKSTNRIERMYFVVLQGCCADETQRDQGCRGGLKLKTDEAGVVRNGTSTVALYLVVLARVECTRLVCKPCGHVGHDTVGQLGVLE